MSAKQKYETRIVENFLKRMGERAIAIKAHDRPDVIITLQMANNPNVQHVGVEVTRHFNDDPIGEGSGGQRLSNFWASVQEEIEKLKSQSGQLHEVYACVHLKKKPLEQARLPSLVKKLAEEIFRFVKQAAETVTSNIIVIPNWEERKFSKFDGYPIMREYVGEVKVHKGFFAFWDANVSAAYIGISAKRMAEIIREKGEKARVWNTEALSELWLLIAAPHDTVFNAMHNCPEQAHLDDSTLLAACSATPFDKIFFWSSAPHEWHRQIWPKVS